MTTRAVTRLVPESARTEGEVLVELVPEELERGAIAVAASATDDDLLDVPGFDDVVFGIAVEAGVETFNFGECFQDGQIFILNLNGGHGHLNLKARRE